MCKFYARTHKRVCGHTFIQWLGKKEEEATKLFHNVRVITWYLLPIAQWTEHVAQSPCGWGSHHDWSSLLGGNHVHHQACSFLTGLPAGEGGPNTSHMRFLRQLPRGMLYPGRRQIISSSVSQLWGWCYNLPTPGVHGAPQQWRDHINCGFPAAGVYVCPEAGRLEQLLSLSCRGVWGTLAVGSPISWERF